MKRLFILLAGVVIYSMQFLYAQDFSAIASGHMENEISAPLESYHDYAESLPRPQGGYKQIIQKIDYPLAAKSSKTEGTVILLAYINEYGDVKSVKIIKNIGFGCGEAAAKAVAKAEFVPAIKNGENAPVKVVIPVKFQLYRKSF